MGVYVTEGAAYLVHPGSGRTGVVSDYERYELLGDKVLGLCVTELLLDKYVSSPEGEVSRMVNMLVSKRVLSQVSRRLDLDRLFVHRLATLSTSVSASMCEVVIAALYRERGWPAARRFVYENWRMWLDNPEAIPTDYKTRLQEYTVRGGYSMPTYGVLEKLGPDHACSYKCFVRVDGLGEANGTGVSKREAEEAAVQVLCESCSIEL